MSLSSDVRHCNPRADTPTFNPTLLSPQNTDHHTHTLILPTQSLYYFLLSLSFFARLISSFCIYIIFFLSPRQPPVHHSTTPPPHHPLFPFCRVARLFFFICSLHHSFAASSKFSFSRFWFGAVTFSHHHQVGPPPTTHIPTPPLIPSSSFSAPSPPLVSRLAASFAIFIVLGTHNFILAHFLGGLFLWLHPRICPAGPWAPFCVEFLCYLQAHTHTHMLYIQKKYLDHESSKNFFTKSIRAFIFESPGVAFNPNKWFVLRIKIRFRLPTLT